MADSPRPDLTEPTPGEGSRGEVREGARPRWTWLAALGLLMAGIAPILMVAAALLWGLSIADDIGFFLITAAVALIGSFLVWRFGTWSKIVGLLAALVVGAMLFWTVFGLFTPQSFFDFVPGLLLMPGALIAIVCCIAAIVARRRNHLSDAPIGGERRGIRIVLAVVLGLAAVSGILTLVTALGGGDVGKATMAANDFDFKPATLEVNAGETIVITNNDPFAHTFTVDDLDINEALSPGQEVEIKIPDKAGSYIFYCMPHTSTPKQPTDDDMAGDLTIK